MGLFKKKKVNWTRGLLFDYFMVEDSGGDLKYMADIQENEAADDADRIFGILSKIHERQPVKWLAIQYEDGKPKNVILSWNKKGVYSTSCFAAGISPEEGQKLLSMIAERAKTGFDEFESFRIIRMDKF